MNLKLVAQTITNRHKSNRGKCLDLLQSEKALADIALFWDRYAGSFELIGTSVLVKYIKENSFSDKELDVAKKMIGDFIKFFDDCNIEYYNRSKGD